MGAWTSKGGGGGGGEGADATECARCGDALGEQISLVLGQALHPECHTCQGPCSRQLEADEEFFLKEGKGGQKEAWCEKCFTEAAPECHGCEEPILQGKVFTTHGRSFHADCFICADCGKLCQDEEQFYVDVVRDGEDGGGKPEKKKEKKNKKDKAARPAEDGDRVFVYCRACNFKGLDEGEEEEEDGNAHCSWCEEPVEGKGVRALNRRWHEECFRCNDCEVDLLEVKEGFFHVDGRLYCRNDQCVFARDHDHKGRGRVDKRKRNQLLEVIKSPLSGLRRVRQRKE